MRALALLFAFAMPAFALEVPAEFRGDTQLVTIAQAWADTYPKDFEGVFRAANGTAIFRFDGRDFPYTDGRRKSFDEALDAPDLRDTFAQVYPLKNPVEKVPENFDPGRFRVEELCKVLFGGSESEVSKNCVKVKFCGQNVRFNSRIGAAEALAKVSDDLEAVFAQKPALREYAQNLGGTFNWRNVAGTQRLSNHSFGTAIDLNVSKSAYWKWQSPATLATFSRAWPIEIVEAFEKHGFIWGGKWWHFDTMHFEYRPELLAYARAHPADPAPWPAK